MRRKFFVICLAGLLSLSSKAQDNAASLKTEVMTNMMNLRNALLSKDSVALSSLLADDVAYGHSNGLIQTKPEVIRSIVSAEQDYKSIESSDMNVRVYDDNTGVVSLKLKVNVVLQGKAMDLNMYAVFTWVKIKGTWKLVARQSVKLPA